ncbi:hypothetical protein LU631_18630 [Erwinia tracheiphila]|nr:hypothetical protein [Erwinia tracheiphila]UIA84889.1 hypothetical protein LU604_08305 [Erwinia tracheiphila]UIA86842.1 hypothetical protein LU631_18630 [Erwinia tracheiphila]UIA93485.1 hypothetical protein LU632_08265 [Erwinia tracheiphila]
MPLARNGKPGVMTLSGGRCPTGITKKRTEEGRDEKWPISLSADNQATVS